MSHSPNPSTTPSGQAGHVPHGDADLEVLCNKIRTAAGRSAKHLPVQVLSYLAKSLNRIEIDIYVEECLPMVCDASHAFVRAMGTFSTRHADCDSIEQTRVRLIQALETLADEMRLCKVRSAPPSHRIRIAAIAEDQDDVDRVNPTAQSAPLEF